MPGVDGREKTWAEPSPSDFDRWEALVAEGMEPGEAARSLPQKFRGSSTFGRTDPKRHREVLDLAQELKRTRASKSGFRALVEIAEDPEAPESARVAAANTLVRIGGLLTERVEVTGAEGGPIQVEDRSASLDDVASVLVAVGALPAHGGEPARPALPDVTDVLSDPPVG